MYKTIRLALLITPSGRTAVAETAKAADEVFQSARAQSFVCNTARRLGPWAPRKQRHVTWQLPAVHRG